MNIEIVQKNVELDDKTRNYIMEKMSRVVRDVARVSHAHVVLSREPHLYVVEVILPIEHTVLCANEKASTLEAAIDLVEDKLLGQIRKLKDKIVSRHKHTHERRNKNLILEKS